ncbi:MAG: FAD-dependent oxidoreductase [Spirochaetia bacterium]|jgi:pyruvate/2-oxoglutarate dehydrogenase complex dihydrolipoamide dehydrogenase (E3) component|nr:FAD-dependent oxidoreductase [Spirochaetia bacterium]
MKKWDVIIIGGGGTGITAAFTTKGFGKKTLLIEKEKMGGECTWNGCIPSKTLINIAHKAHVTKEMTGQLPDLTKIMETIKTVQEQVFHHESPKVLADKGIDYINGTAFFTGKNTLSVNGEEITAKKFIIATGTSPMVPPIEGIESVPYITNETIFKIAELPKSLIILGGGPIGVELGQALNRLGVSVTLIERNSIILPRDEKNFSDRMADILLKEGVKIEVNASAVKVEKTGKSIFLTAERNNKEFKIEAQNILIAVGRKANLDLLDLGKAGVKINTKGITVNKHLVTSNPNIYAAGDITGPYLFSHMAEYQGKTAAMNAILPWKSKVNYNHIAWTTFTEPEMAHAGLTEADFPASKVRVFKYDFKDLDRTMTHPGESGLLKIVCDKKYRIVGASIIGPRAGELIGEIQIMKTLGIPLTKAVNVIHPYPTYADIIRQIAKKAYLDKVMNNPIVKLVQMFKK